MPYDTMLLRSDAVTLFEANRAGWTQSFFGLPVKSTWVIVTTAYDTMWYWALSPGLMTVSYRGTIRDVPAICSNFDLTDVVRPLSPVAMNGTYRAPSGATRSTKSEFWKSA